MKTTELSKDRLISQFSGTNSPAEMGTTGLVAWMLAGPSTAGNRWERFKIARRIMEKRNGKNSVILFCRAIIATATLYQIDVRRFANALKGSSL